MFIVLLFRSFYMASKEDVYECCDIVLKNLQTDYLDLFLVYAHTIIVICKNKDCKDGIQLLPEIIIIKLNL